MILLQLYLLGVLTDFLYDTKRLWGFSRGKLFVNLMMYNALTCWIFPIRIYIRYKMYKHQKSMEKALYKSLKALSAALAEEIFKEDNKEKSKKNSKNGDNDD